MFNNDNVNGIYRHVSEGLHKIYETIPPLRPPLTWFCTWNLMYQQYGYRGPTYVQYHYIHLLILSET